MKYTYLYQDKQNRNCSGEIAARNRADAYLQLRKQGIRPYRVIGDDPWDWRPWAIGGGYAVLLLAVGILGWLLIADAREDSRVRRARHVLSAEEAEAFRARAEEAVYQAPEAYRYNVWKGVNARLEERGLEPLPMPSGMNADGEFEGWLP